MWGETGRESEFRPEHTLVEPQAISFSNSCTELVTEYIMFSEQENGSNDLLVVGLRTEKDTTVSITVTERIVIEIYIFYYIMMAVISFISAFLLVCTIILIFRRRLTRNRQPPTDHHHNLEHFEYLIPPRKALHSELSCPICLQLIEVGDTIRSTLCEHTFHQLCLDAWCIKTLNCPICRSELSPVAMKRQQEQINSRQGKIMATNKEKYRQNWEEEVEMEESPQRVDKQQLT